jgi:hypothetical protein
MGTLSGSQSTNLIGSLWGPYDLAYGDMLYEFNVGPEALGFFRQISCKNVPYFYDTLMGPILTSCYTTHISFSADHGGQQFWPIPLPVAR